MSLVNQLQRAKHQLLVGRKRLAAGGRWARDNAVYPVVNSLRLDEFRHGRYSERDGQYPMDYFLHRGPEQEGTGGVAPERIFVVWAGENPLTPNRSEGLQSIRAAQLDQVEVVLVTPDNLREWEVPGSPIHPAYEHLSLIHRSDYLRCYLMHHHGGGYTDIKRTTADWSPLFRALNSNADAWVLGYPEESSREAVYMESPIGWELRRRFRELAGNGAFICKPGTPFTSAWFDEVSSRMDYFQRSLARYPATEPFGGPGYPLPWTVLQAQVFQPLQLQYLDHVMLDATIRPSMRDHR